MMGAEQEAAPEKNKIKVPIILVSFLCSLLLPMH